MSKSVLLVTKTDLVEYRFNTLLQELDIDLLVSSSKADALMKLNYPNNIFDLCILDLDNGEEIFELIDEINKLKINKPIITLSSQNNRKMFLRVVKLGIDDFIIKPFDNIRIKDTLNKYFKFGEETLRHLTGSYEEKVKFEMKKASKGKYPITFVFFIFMGDYRKKSATKYMKNIRKKLWDTDEVLFFNEYSLLGIYPFSGETESKLLEEKLKLYYLELTKNNTIFENTDMMLKMHIYPDNIAEYDVLINNYNKILG